MTARPLDDVRVLDFTWVVAGPVATRVLADLGADVLRIERPNTPDLGDRRGGLTGSLMRGKRSLVIDLHDPRGVDLVRRLAARCDVVIDNFSARVMPNLGLDYATLRAINPGVICARMTGYGLTGPARDHVSYGPTLQALAGYTAMMAEPGEPPAGFGYSYSDLASGHAAALAVLAALWHRRRTGLGQQIDLSQLEVAASLVGPLLLERVLDGRRSAPGGNASAEGPAAPHGVYPCAGHDRWIAITILDDAEWTRFARALGDPEWTRQPALASVEGRVTHAAAVDRHVAAWTSTVDAEVAMNVLQGAGVAAGLVADARDLCARDPQLRARGHFVDVPTPEGRTVRLDGPPFLLSGTPARVGGPGPLPGEHSTEILRELGLDEDHLLALRTAGVIRESEPRRACAPATQACASSCRK